MSSLATLWWRWYLPLAAGIVPVLVVGFAASALANRLVFAGWAIAVAAGFTVGLRFGLDSRWSPRLLQGLLLLWLAGGFGVLAALIKTHALVLDLGIQALLPALGATELVRPATAGVVAVALAAGGAVDLLLARRRARRPA